MVRSPLHALRFRRDHRWSLEHMSDFLDGDLETDERARLEHHRDECPDCTRVLATLATMVEGLHGLRGAPGRSVAEDVLEGVRRELARGETGADGRG